MCHCRVASRVCDRGDHHIARPTDHRQERQRPAASRKHCRVAGKPPVRRNAAGKHRQEIFGENAPVWPFLTRFGGPRNPLERIADQQVFETYPVLAIIALGWSLADSRAAGRLPKYNPLRKKIFSISDWQYLCGVASAAFQTRGLTD